MQPNQTSIPTAVLRKWKAAFEPEVPKEPKPTLKDVNVNLQEENHQLKVHIAELEAARSTDEPATVEGQAEGRTDQDDQVADARDRTRSEGPPVMSV